ncbi:MAG: hypothetical protein JOY86_02300 [Candidatus Eremiobacteraeota bacterium]|nr:hypothetical protein [Candidatus Eremiobacteraeota bacterium]
MSKHPPEIPPVPPAEPSGEDQPTGAQGEEPPARGIILMRVLGWIALCARVAALAAGGMQPAAAAQANLAYDAITKVIISGTPPPPDNFASDADLIAKLPPMKMSNPTGQANTARATGLLTGLISSIPGVGSLIATGAAMAAGAASNAAQQHAQEEQQRQSRAIMAAGRLTSFAFYGDWMREKAGNVATISKPDEGVTLHVNYETHSYAEQRVDPNITTYTVDATPPPTASIVDAPVVTRLAATVIEHRPVRGYHLHGSVESSQDLGFCKAGRTNIDIVEYVSDLPDPVNARAAAPDPIALLTSACTPSTTASSFEPGKLVLYRTFSVHPSIAGDLIIASELGNFKTIEDRSLFSPPPGFTEEH